MKSKLRVLPWVILLLPLDLIVIAGFFFAEGLRQVGWFANKGSAGRTTPSALPAQPPIVCNQRNVPATIVIVNWDGKHLLAESLPPVIDAIRHDGGAHEVLVVDNGSTDGSVEFVKQRFPDVRILALDDNYGFGGGNNRAVENVRTPIIVFLNNDMIVDREFLTPLLNSFRDESVFAVTSQIQFADRGRRREETGKTRARFEAGCFYFWHDDLGAEDEARETIPVFWAGGGSCAVDRKKFLMLGGFDSLYAPFYVEDTDLSYQAWKRGWKCLLAPASRVLHKHRSTTRPKFGERFVNTTIRRNTYLFIWKNVTGRSMIREHLISLPRVHGRAMLQTSPYFEIQAFVRAVFRLPAALYKRLINLPEYVLSDAEVLTRSQYS